MAVMDDQFNLPCSKKLGKAVRDYKKRKGIKYVTTLFWTSVATQHPELAQAIQEDRL